MRIVFVKLIIIFLFFGVQEMIAQTSFPSSWEGSYSGELQIFGVDSIKMQLDMKLHIERKTDSIYSWEITYIFNGNEDVRNYELHLKDKEKGYYVIDEKNSILIDSYYKSDIFTSFFKVSQSFIISTYTKKASTIEFEIIAANENLTQTSGNAEVNGEEIPEVTSFLVNGRQKAILQKQ